MSLWRYHILTTNVSGLRDSRSRGGTLIFRKVVVMGTIVTGTVREKYVQISPQPDNAGKAMDIHIRSENTFGIVVKRLEVEYQSTNIRIKKVNTNIYKRVSVHVNLP